MLSNNTATFDTSSTPTPVVSTSWIFMFLFLSASWILRIHSVSGHFCFQNFLIFFVSHFDICTRFPNWFDVINNWNCISIRSFRWTYEHTAMSSPFPDCSSYDNDQYRSNFWSLSISLLETSRNWKYCFEIDWNEFILSVAVQQFLKVSSPFLTNFTVNRNHVVTVLLEEKTHVVLGTRSLQHKTLCTPMSLPFRDLSNPFSSYPWFSKRNWTYESVARLFPTLVPSNRTPVVIALIETPVIVPFFTHPSFHEVSMVFDCADFWMSELASDF